MTETGYAARALRSPGRDHLQGDWQQPAFVGRDQRRLRSSDHARAIGEQTRDALLGAALAQAPVEQAPRGVDVVRPGLHDRREGGPAVVGPQDHRRGLPGRERAGILDTDDEELVLGASDAPEPLRVAISRSHTPEWTPRFAELLGGPEAVRERYARRYVPGQRLYLDKVRPEQLADLVVLNDDPDRPLIASRDPS